MFSTTRAEIQHKIISDKALFMRKHKGQIGYLHFTEELKNKVNMSYVFTVVSQILSSKEKKDLEWQRFQGTTEEFRRLRALILDQDGNIKIQYLGMPGYAHFADKYHEGDMFKTYNNISASLDKKQKIQLKWQRFQGTTEEFRRLRTLILDQEGNIKTQYLGMPGYAHLADKYYKGDMVKTYNNISASLDKQQKIQLKWQRFQGTTEEFRRLRALILDQEGNIKTQYLGMLGYAHFADKYYKGDMVKTHNNISASLDKKQKIQLKWQRFQGTTEEFRRLRTLILDQEGNIKIQYLGMLGYTHFADEYYKGDMVKTYNNISASLDKKQMLKLNWRQFQGTTEEFKRLRALILNQEGNIKIQYLGMKGYARFADKYYKGDMVKTYNSISASLDKQQMLKLNWRQFQGTTKEFKRLRTLILDQKRNIKIQYLGMPGYAHFADKYYKGDMIKTHNNISASLDKQQMLKLNWQQFHGTTEEFKRLRTLILNQEGNIKTQFKIQYLGMEGYARFADKHHEGDMVKTYNNISAVLGGAKIISQIGLGWKSFQGTVKQFYALKNLFKRTDIENLKGENGQNLVAKEIFDGDEQKANRNVSNLRTILLDKPSDFQELRWLRIF